jgi:energy-coupling factor transporter ATP-binding protein EcfA2
VSKWFLKSIEINGGFLPGFCLSLPAGLTCIIGPRGSGKSTFVEALRFGMAGPSRASKKRLDLIEANLGPGSLITLSTCSTADGGGYTIRRGYKEQVSLIDDNGKAITTVDLDRGTFLPLDAYSDKEIESIADDSLGDRRRSLLDELESGPLSQIHLCIAEQRRALEANSDKIRAASRLINDLTEQIEEMGDARARLDALPPLVEGVASEAVRVAARQCQLNAQENRHLDDSIKSVTGFRVDLEALITGMYDNASDPSAPLDSSAGSANVNILETAQTEINSYLSAARQQIGTAIDSLKMAESKLLDTQTDLIAVHTEQDAQYAKLMEKDAAAGRIIQERTSAEDAVSRLDQITSQRADVRSQLQRLEVERKTLRGNYLLERGRLSELRERVAQRLENEAGAKVRIRVRRNGDNTNYQQLLTEALRGARVRNQTEIVEKLMRLQPDQLAQLITKNNLSEFEAQMSLGDERARKVLENLRLTLDPLNLETTAIDDRIFIELNLSTGSVSNFKDASELSRGQKCTALLPLLLARRDSPLVIDQPEDNLDNHFIYETVVENIRRMKVRRQMVFITHNANIPVLAEADLVVVLNSDGKIGYIEKAGTLDECREEIIDLLEGGREAFELRSRKYGKW